MIFFFFEIIFYALHYKLFVYCNFVLLQLLKFLKLTILKLFYYNLFISCKSAPRIVLGPTFCSALGDLIL